MSLTATSSDKIEPAVGVENCPVCGASNFKLVHGDAHDPITLDAFQVLRCSSCGVAYTAPVPPSLDRYYPRQYRAYGTVVARILESLYGLRVLRWARFKPQGGTVLEIGCGSGLMLAAFRRRGWSVSGIERNADAVETARESLGEATLVTSLQELPPHARFDLIVMFQVLEHMGKPVALLRQCAELLAPGGRIIANVPNFSSWQSQFAGSKWMHLDVPRHLIHYTPRSISETFQRAGLTVSSLSFTSLEHDPYGWVESTISMLTGHANTLNRFLVGLDPMSFRVFISFTIGAALFPFAFLLAGVSWLARRGALMEATAVDSKATSNERSNAQ